MIHIQLPRTAPRTAAVVLVLVETGMLMTFMMVIFLALSVSLSM